jgi:hypothetical protein
VDATQDYPRVVEEWPATRCRGRYRFLTTQILRLCADYIDQLAVLDPVHASVLGIGAEYGAATDYSPDGYAAS